MGYFLESWNVWIVCKEVIVVFGVIVFLNEVVVWGGKVVFVINCDKFMDDVIW